jgi:hypothetical protein
MDKKYDIFISFKNSDANGNRTRESEIAEELYYFLTDKGFEVFYSNKELEHIGKTRYSSVIANALDSSSFLIVIGCSRENLENDWVSLEWESFLNNIRRKTKIPPTDVYVVYENMKANDLPWFLRDQQLFDAGKKDSFNKLYNFIFNAINTYKKLNKPAESIHNKTEIKNNENILININKNNENMNYDIFISFKNSDENGNRTKDSVIAEKLYEILTNKGYKVFFSNKTINKSQFTRVIDDALDSAQILIAVGCSYENLNSQWVRYEWESFLSDMRNNIKPNAELFCVYKDMKRVNLPRPLRNQQSFDVGKEDSFDKLYNIIQNSDFNYRINNSENLKEMKIGIIVRTVLCKILEESKVSAEEIELMQTKKYSKKTFDLQYSLLLKAEIVNEIKPKRYYSKPVIIRGVRYFVCSEWFEVPANNDRLYLRKWLELYNFNI